MRDSDAPRDDCDCVMDGAMANLDGDCIDDDRTVGGDVDGLSPQSPDATLP